MKAFCAFCKKELTESIRTYRLLILLVTFVIFGIISPLLAKMLPNILSGVDLGGGITIDIPEPTAFDSWTQFFGNIGQMGLLILAIVFAGITTNEFSRGTLVNVLTKGMRRSTVIWSKFTVATTLWTLAYMLSWVVTFAYTAYYWGTDTLLTDAGIGAVLLAFGGLWAFGLLLLALLILGGIFFKSVYGSLSIAGAAVVVMSLLSISPRIQKYNPLSLAGDTLNLLNQQKVPADFMPALIVCLVLTMTCVLGALLIFNRKQL